MPTADAAGAVHQQVGEPGGEHLGLPQGLVKVGVPVHRVLLDVPKHLLRQPGQPGLGITVSSRGIAVNGAEVAVALYQGTAHGEILSQADQGIVYAGVSVGVVLTQHIAHAGG